MRRLDDHAQHDIITACDLSKPPTAPSLSSHINAVSPSFDHTRHIAVRIRIRVIENQSNKSFVRSSPVRCKCGASAGPVDSSLRRDRPTDRPAPDHSTPGYSFVGCICWRVRPLDCALRVCSVYNERRIFS